MLYSNGLHRARLIDEELELRFHRVWVQVQDLDWSCNDDFLATLGGQVRMPSLLKSLSHVQRAHCIHT